MPILLMILATILWGVSFLITKLALQEISTTSFLFYRYAVATVSLLPVFLFNPVSINKKLIKPGIYLSLLQAALIFTQTLGLETISASLSSFVAGFYIVFVLLIRFVITKNLPTTVDIIATLLCLAGLGLLTNSFGNPDPVGIGLTFISAFVIAVDIYVLDKYVNRSTEFALTFLQMIGIMTIFGCVLLCNHQLFQFPTQLLTWISILVAGIGCSSIAYWVAAKAQTKLGAFKVSIILMLEPVFATIFAYFGLGEQLSLMSFLGMGMILIAIGIINWRLKVSPSTTR